MWRALAVPLLLASSAAAGAPAAPEVEVAPGAIVRWPGQEVERCGMGGAKWDARDGTCWYAIDLLTPAGTLELGRWRDGRFEARRVRVVDYPYPVQHITVAEGQVDLSPADLERVRRENARIGALWSRRGPARSRLPLAAPLSELPAGGRFGARRFFNGQPRSPHSGSDYAVPAGTPVLAAADGVVALAGDFFFSGRSLFVDHGDGLITMYFHLSEMAVDEGAAVARGQAIGRVGQSGRATGPHLHFAARWRRARVDPALLLAPDEAVELR